MARKRKQEEINEQNNIVVNEPQIVYRIKDAIGNTNDYATIEEMANDQGINLGICYKYLNKNKRFCGKMIYTVKK